MINLWNTLFLHRRDFALGCFAMRIAGYYSPRDE